MKNLFKKLFTVIFLLLFSQSLILAWNIDITTRIFISIAVVISLVSYLIIKYYQDEL
jgi:hypothetical protein